MRRDRGEVRQKESEAIRRNRKQSEGVGRDRGGGAVVRALACALNVISTVTGPTACGGVRHLKMVGVRPRSGVRGACGPVPKRQYAEWLYETSGHVPAKVGGKLESAHLGSSAAAASSSSSSSAASSSSASASASSSSSSASASSSSSSRALTVSRALIRARRAAVSAVRERLWARSEGSRENGGEGAAHLRYRGARRAGRRRDWARARPRCSGRRRASCPCPRRECGGGYRHSRRPRRAARP